MKILQKMHLMPILILVILSYWSIKPLIGPGYFPMHDDTQPARIFEMAKEIKSLQLPVRWVGDLGYGFGYPLFNFYAPLPYYIGAVFNLAGVDAITSAKLMIVIAVLLSGIGMFLLVRDYAGDLAGLTAATLYIYAPYHAVNTYIRGSVGELYAYAFLPFFIMGVFNFIKTKLSVKTLLLISLSLAAILLSHNILGMLVLYFVIFWLIIYFCFLILNNLKFNNLFLLLILILLGIGISSFFTVPAVLEKKYTQVESLTLDGSDYRNHFVYLGQLWDSPWGYAGSAPGSSDGMSFKIGKTHLILGLISLGALIYLRRKKMIKKFHISIFTFLITTFLLSVFFMLDLSKFIWEFLPGFSYIQYPWRFLNFTSLALAILSSFAFFVFRGRFQLLIAIVIIFSTILVNKKYFIPKFLTDANQEDYISDNNLRFKISKISDEYLPSDFKAPLGPQDIASQGISESTDIKIKNLKETSTKKEYSLEIKRHIKLMTNIAFFPGWQGFVDGSKIDLESTGGRISFDIEAGNREILLELKNSPIRSVANTISLSSLFLLVYVSLFGIKNIYDSKRNSRDRHSDI